MPFAGWELMDICALPPQVGTDGTISAQDARHPVLVLRDRDPIGNSLHIDPKKPGLVLTGPNAGGKTIVLKTLGKYLTHSVVNIASFILTFCCLSIHGRSSCPSGEAWYSSPSSSGGSSGFLHPYSC